MNPKNVAMHAKLQVSITSELEQTHFTNTLGYSKPQLLSSSRDSAAHCMSTFYVKGAGCTQAATQTFDIQLLGTLVFFLNISQLYKHHAVLVSS